MGSDKNIRLILAIVSIIFVLGALFSFSEGSFFSTGEEADEPAVPRSSLTGAVIVYNPNDTSNESVSGEDVEGVVVNG